MRNVKPGLEDTQESHPRKQLKSLEQREAETG